MNNFDPYAEFNKQGHEFLSKMEKTFPKEKKIQQYRHLFEQIRKYNSRKPVEMFMDNLQPFGLQILSRDEQFFMKDQYVKNVESLSGKLGLIDYWENMHAETQNAIWSYMQLLYALGMTALGRQEEYNEMVSKVNC